MLTAALLLAGCARREGPPDLMLITLDTFRADRVGAYGNPDGLTPNLDRFAREGIVFERAYSQGTFTAPSHASLFTSRYPPEMMRSGRHPELGDDKPTIAQVLGAYGYETGAFVAGGDLAPEIGLTPGFDVYESPHDFGSFFHTVPPALAWIDARKGDRPWFVFLHSYDTHSPYRKPPPLGSIATDPTREGLGGEALSTQTTRVVDGFLLEDMRLFLRLNGGMARPRSAKGRAEFVRQAESAGTPRLDDDDLAQITGAYEGTVAYEDARFGLLMAELDRRGVLDHTVVMVVSDHGESMHEACVFNHCCQIDDTTTHVPLLVRLPWGRGRRSARGRRRRADRRGPHPLRARRGHAARGRARRLAGPGAPGRALRGSALRVDRRQRRDAHDLGPLEGRAHHLLGRAAVGHGRGGARVRRGGGRPELRDHRPRRAGRGAGARRDGRVPPLVARAREAGPAPRLAQAPGGAEEARLLGEPVILALLACGGPTWTPEGALSPFVTKLDADGDGRVTVTEVRMAPRDFEAMDTDDDGALSVAELGASLALNDPDRWSQGVLRPSPEMASLMRQEQTGDRTGSWILQVLREEVIAADPEADVPTREEIADAAGQGIGSPEWVAARDRLVAAWQKAGMTFPWAIVGS
jgi:arylsulfatase A-like enzyme